MWTPKRVLLLAVGFALFSMAYLVYAHFLGGINGLPPLPDDYRPIASGEHEPLPIDEHENEADYKLRLAFGPDCDEVKNRNIKVELQSRGMVLAAQDLKFIEGRVRLTPFSLAMFGKDHDGNPSPEINTIKCNEAMLTFDKPVNNIAEMGNNVRKIIGAELTGDVTIINNRRTPQRDDDLSLFTQGPLYYQESLHRVWTGAVAEVKDLQSKPKPMSVRGTGLHLYFAAEPKPAEAGKPAAAPAKAGTTMKLERIEFESDVNMNLSVDAHSGFLGSSKEEKEPSKRPTADKNIPAREPTQADKADVTITTQGPFRYDLLTDRATFDLSHHPGPGRNIVTVNRYNELEQKHDCLECDHLEIQFQRKNGPTAPTAATSQADGLVMETVHATGKEVVITSDAEMLEAHGTDLFYNKNTHLSILKGQPRMWALKEGNEIEAPELHLLDVKGAQQATALGQGHIRMLDKKTGDRPLEAHWKTKLVYGKDGAYDLLSLAGDASFVDHEHGQQLLAQLIKVWLEPSKEAKPAPSGDPQRPLPHHVEAVGQVRAIATDLRVHDTEHLIIQFKDVPASALPASAPLREAPSATPVADRPAAPPPGRPAATPARPPAPDSAERVTAAKPAESAGAAPVRTTASAAASGTSGTTSAAPAPAKPKKPMDLSAHDIEVHALRSGAKNELDELWCGGNVRVLQEPSGPEDKGADIRGDKLHLTRQADGNILRVTGDHAQVQMDKLYIVGPDINMDQTTNEVEVFGMGAMRLPSDGNVGSTKLAAPAGPKTATPTDVTIHWENKMYFNGKFAQFDWPSGPRSRRSVLAEQNNGRVACRAMQVTLDRMISLRENDKSKEPAKVQIVVCDQEVWVEDSKHEGPRLTEEQRIVCPQLTLDNGEEKDDSIVHASGPGTVYLFQRGTKRDAASPAGPPTPHAPTPGSRTAAKPVSPQGQPSQGEGEPTLTRVSFQSRMDAHNKQGLATFYDKVVVLHFPTRDPHVAINENHLPAGYLYLSCEKLQVLQHKLPEGKNYQEMRAYTRVAIESQEFSGAADIVSYDESKEQVILEGSAGNFAVLTKQKVQGAEPDRVYAKKITYWRLTGNYSVEDGKEIRVGQ